MSQEQDQVMTNTTHGSVTHGNSLRFDLARQSDGTQSDFSGVSARCESVKCVQRDLRTH